MSSTVRTLLLLVALWPVLGAAQRYVSFEPEKLTLDDGPAAAATILLRTSEGNTIALPWVADQTGFEAVKISPDHQRVGWITLKHNICCSDPIGLIIFAGGKIERVIDGCITNWRFGDAGPVVTYWTEPCHNATSAQFFMIDTSSNFVIAQYLFDYLSADSDFQLPGDTPQWVQDLYVLDD